MASYQHIPVLLQEVMTALNPQPGLLYVDGTLGGAGHATALLKQQPLAQLVGFDRDAQALAVAKTRLPQSVRLIHAPFASMAIHLPAHSITGGVLLDLGVSSPQLDQAERGFSFMHNAPLDMRMDQLDDSPTAADLLADATEAQLVDWFKQYGEERLAKPIARAIKQQPQPITTTKPLAELCRQAYARFRIKEQQNPATRVFQALRIAVNGELDQLTGVLDQLPGLLAPGARVAIISFHSLEDRIVKQWMVKQAARCVCPPRLPICQCGKVSTLSLISRKPIMATSEEVAINPRSRSAKLRVGEWI